MLWHWPEFISKYKLENNVDTRGRFHQQFTSSFYTLRFQKSKKRLTAWLYFFALLGFARVKAALKMWMKLTPDVGPGPHLNELLTLCHSKTPLPLSLPLSTLLLLLVSARRLMRPCRSRRRACTWRRWRSSSGKVLPMESLTNPWSCPTKSQRTPENWAQVGTSEL